jgi:hypothetical protein
MWAFWNMMMILYVILLHVLGFGYFSSALLTGKTKTEM